ncbi:MAG TPA: hypothetical protein VLT45_19695 [Kofleriaceae bacterium]|nr:hypothetical protein [Kofleriaceae bacterium]
MSVLALCGGVAGCGSSPSHAGDANADADAIHADAAAPPPCRAFDITVPVSSPSPVFWTGSEYLLLSQAQPGVIERISSDGTPGPTFPLGVDVGPFTPLAWTGSELGVLSASSGGLVLSRFAADGTARGTSTVATGVDNVARGLVWAGDRYLAGWNVPTQSVAIEEIDADGTPAATHLFRSGSPDVGGVSFNTIDAIAATSTTFLVEVSYNAGTPAYVTIDRASGALAHYNPRTSFAPTEVLARTTDFVFFTDDADRPSMDGPGLVTLDARATPTYGPLLPALNASDLIAVPSGYRLSTATVDNNTMTYAIQKLDLDPDGAPLGALTQIATAPSNMSFGYPGATFRGNGILTAFEYGPNGAWTQHLIQECLP